MEGSGKINRIPRPSAANEPSSQKKKMIAGLPCRFQLNVTAGKSTNRKGEMSRATHEN
jgi:hypothetical protein